MTLFLFILYIGNKASLAIRHKVHRSLEMLYCGVPLYYISLTQNLWGIGYYWLCNVFVTIWSVRFVIRLCITSMISNRFQPPVKHGGHDDEMDVICSKMKWMLFARGGRAKYDLPPHLWLNLAGTITLKSKPFENTINAPNASFGPSRWSVGR